jgi:NADH dehydrogenase FAD-containing subunit
LSAAAKQRLEKFGAEVRLGHGVDQIDDNGVIAAGERIASRTVIWTAGVAHLPAGKWLNADTDPAGRMRIQPDLTVPGHLDISVIGRHRDAQSGRQTTGRRRTVAMQQGRYAGRLIQRRVTGKPEPPPFRCIISLHRQGHHGCRRSRLCRLTTRVAAKGIG